VGKEPPGVRGTTGQDAVRQVRAFRAIAASLQASRNLEAVLEGCLRAACRAAGAPGGAIFLLEPSGAGLRLAADLRLGPAAVSPSLTAPDGLPAWALATGHPVARPLQAPPDGDLLAAGFRTAAAFPLRDAEGLSGSLLLLRRRPFGEADLALLLPVAGQVALAAGSAALYHEAWEKTARLEGLIHLTRDMLGQADPETVYRAAARAAAGLLGVELATLWLLEQDSLVLRAVAGRETAATLQGGRLPAHEGLGALLLRSRRLVEGPEAAEERAWRDRPWVVDEGLRAFAAAPLVWGDAVSGILAVFRKSPRLTTPLEQDLLSFLAAQAAAAVETVRLFASLERHRDDLEALVQERTRQAEEALRVRSQFLANVSHELRTPVQAILGFAELLKQPDAERLTGRQAEFLGNIAESAHHLQDLIRNVLDLARLEAGRLSLALDSFPVLDAVRESVRHVQGMAHKKGIRFHLEATPGVDRIEADLGKVRQILYNLLSNAVKFTPEGGAVRVEVTARDLAAGGSGPGGRWARYYEIRVEDTGIGIDSLDLPRIFQPFVTLHQPAPEAQSSGLGLNLTKQLVELHGGTIWAESPGPGLGATFTVLLPATQGEAGP
jgi:signal transduction histidine kinase